MLCMGVNHINFKSFQIILLELFEFGYVKLNYANKLDTLNKFETWLKVLQIRVYVLILIHIKTFL